MYNGSMARGWESKSVEAQVEERLELAADRELRKEQRESRSKRDSLDLSRARVLQEIAECRNPRYKELLVKSLEHLDEKLSEFQAGKTLAD
jgi:hypothetical protein